MDLEAAMRRIVKFFIPSGLFKRVEPYGHLLESVLMNIRYGFPARNLKVIGVTGTDGKTTTTSMIWNMLKDAGYNVGYMTTIGYGTPQSQIANQVHMTTMPSGPMLARIRELNKGGIDWLVLETTSHALAQHRVWGVPYSIAVMTNVGHEHLDYHGTFERYRDAKRELFKKAQANSNGLHAGVVNADDPSAPLFAGEVQHPWRYGVEQGDYQAINIKSTSAGSTYTLQLPDQVVDGKPDRGEAGRLSMTVNIPGRFNVYNSLAAACVGLALGLEHKQIESGIASLRAVEGRMTKVDAGQDFSVIVDFAHTPDSFETLLSDMRASTKPPQRLIVMFGSAGRRDEGKRAIQGRIAGKYADLVVATEEDDRDIDGEMILNQIAGGAEESGKTRDKDLFLVHDRVDAIKFSLSQAKKGDTVMLLGKGHEKTIERAHGEIPWDEVGEATEAIKALIDNGE